MAFIDHYNFKLQIDSFVGRIYKKIVIVAALTGAAMLCHHANCKMPLMPFFHICDPIADKKTAVVECSKGLAPHLHISQEWSRPNTKNCDSNVSNSSCPVPPW